VHDRVVTEVSYPIPTELSTQSSSTLTYILLFLDVSTLFPFGSMPLPTVVPSPATPVSCFNP